VLIVSAAIARLRIGTETFQLRGYRGQRTVLSFRNSASLEEEAGYVLDTSPKLPVIYVGGREPTIKMSTSLFAL
jgi:hypothetical protein